jgi:hypothetical protein
MGLIYLGAVSISTAVVAVSFLAAGGSPSARSWQSAVLCVVAGVLGSAIAALLSVADRVANGWELLDGTPRPEKAKDKEKFNERMVLFFWIRPLLGAAVGAIAYAGATSEMLFKLEGETTVQKLLFLALLSGFFAKTLLDKLKDLFKALVGK